MIARLTGTLAEAHSDHAVIDVAGVNIAGPEAADAIAVAVTHAHHLASARTGSSK